MNIAALSAALRGDIDNARIDATPGGIEQQEAAGQRSLVEGAMIPKKIYGATREQLTAIGFRFGEDVDELFVACDLPQGWTKRATDHAMHTDLLDEQGRARASIFYKAAFYDRRAHVRMNRKFDVDLFRDGRTDQMLRVDVIDAGVVVKDFGEVSCEDFESLRVTKHAAMAWLDEHYPEWKNPMEYW